MSRRKALCVGINYLQAPGGTARKLQGCIRDCIQTQQLLINHFDYTIKDVVVLTDDQNISSSHYPSRANVLKWFDWLISNIKSEDSIFLAIYSNNLICADLQSISSDDLKTCIINKMPSQAKLTVIIDYFCGDSMQSVMPYQFNSVLQKHCNRRTCNRYMQVVSKQTHFQSSISCLCLCLCRCIVLQNTVAAFDEQNNNNNNNNVLFFQEVQRIINNAGNNKIRLDELLKQLQLLNNNRILASISMTHCSDLHEEYFNPT